MQSLLIDVEKYVSLLLRNDLSGKFLYHNLSHTQRVVKSCKEICVGENIAKKETSLILIAAWFHDIGYIHNSHSHEEASMQLAETFLKEKGIDPSSVALILRLIKATKMDYEPQDLLECVIRDADSAHFGSKDYSDICALLRAEWEIVENKKFTDSEWTQENILFYTKYHQFYTDYALENWQNRKDKNLGTLLKKVKKQKKEEQKVNLKATEISLKKDKATLPERGIETMFRVTLRNHIALSDIADTKANILLSVNAIIVSLVMSNLIPKLDNASNTHLIYPTVIFVFFTVIAMILSVFATRPNVTEGKFTKKDVEDKKVNLLFFGNFHKMKLSEFEWAINELMKDKDYLYNSMTKDLYFLGKVLDRKYTILRITYTIFIIGIIASVTAFSIAFKFYA